MEQEYFVWVTSRRIKPGMREELLRAWRPDVIPIGMKRAYVLWTPTGSEVIGISFWESESACVSWRSSEEEKKREQAMAPYVIEETNDYYEGGELKLA